MQLETLDNSNHFELKESSVTLKKGIFVYVLNYLAKFPSKLD